MGEAAAGGATAGGADRSGGRGPDRSGEGALEVVVALDFPGVDPALSLLDRLPEGTWCKVGLELFTAAGPDFVEELVARGHPVFLDLKLHDIPNTVAGATRRAAALGARLLTVHASGGREMLAAAAEAAGPADAAGTTGDAHAGGAAGGPTATRGSSPRLRVLAVTVLTSLDRMTLAEVWPGEEDVEAAVRRLGGLARDAGVDGAVASVAECRVLKEACGADFRVATPGIRLPGGVSHDQKRVATPDEAAAAGADYLVVGRAVTRAENPAEALARVRELAGGTGRSA